MAIGTPLGELLTMTREEAGMAANASTGRNVVDSLKRAIRRNYRRLHAAFDWPHLMIRREEQLQQNERFYSFDRDLDFTRMRGVELLQEADNIWLPVEYGIGAREYNIINSDRGETDDRVRRWQVYENRQYEVWPVPDHDGDVLRLTGLSNPLKLISDSDPIDLDDDMIVLYAAAEWLARQQSADAEIKLQQAADFYNAMRANSQKRFVIDREPAADRGAVWRGPQVYAPGTR